MNLFLNQLSKLLFNLSKYNMYRKVIVFITVTIFALTNCTSQEQESGLPKNRFFVGGSLVTGLGGGGEGFSFSIGGMPEFGYTIAKPLDIGINLNIIYSDFTFRQNIQRSSLVYYNVLTRQKLFNYGIGVFTRLHVANTFFLQAMAEQNFFKPNITFPENSNIIASKETLQSSNILGGIGYGSRAIGEGGFYTLILFDLNKHPNSPYLIGDQAFPIFRAGFIHYFRKKDKNNRNSNNNSRVRDF